MGNIYKDILESIIKDREVNMVTTVDGIKGKIGENLKKEIKEVDRLHSTGEGRETLINEKETQIIEEVFTPEKRLIIFGGGHIAVPLVEFSAKTGFNTVVVDDRLSFANQARFPLAKKVICNSFENAIKDLKIKSSDFIVIITRGHRFDSTCLKLICNGTEPTYVGLIGSKRRVSIVKDDLVKEGVDENKLNRVNTPIGLKIGAITPEEISISILAQLISHRRLSNKETIQDKSDIDNEVIEILGVETDIPKAIVTVIFAKGSVPRGKGAKMIVYRDGQIKGSIGGGCSESTIIGEAIDIIGTKEYIIKEIDLRGGAEDDGMVCGGIMTVLVEDYVPVFDVELN